MDYTTNLNPKFESIQEAESWAAAQGVKLTANDREKIAEAQQAEQERLKALGESESLADKFNTRYATFLDLLLHAGNLLQALTRTLIIAVGIPLVLVFLLVVEQQRIVDGLMLFDAREALAHFGAWALVLVNLGLEFVAHHEDERHGYKALSGNAFSLRIVWHRTKYVLGFGKDWAAREKAPSHWAKRLLKLVTVGVMVLALSGSMRDELASHGGDWNTALDDILHHSTLLEMATWASGLLFAFIAVTSAQGLARYIATRTSEIIAELRAQGQDNSADLEAPGVAYITAKVSRKLERDAAKRQEAQAENPIPKAIAGRNGR
jgi:hypothetical protein